MGHARDIASAIIAKQETVQIKESQPVLFKKKMKILEPDTEIIVSPASPATILEENDSSGGIDEIVVISPNTDFAVTVESDGRTLLDKTYAEISALSQQGKYLTAFQDRDGSYVLNIGEFMTWSNSIKVVLKSTSGQFKFNQVYAKYYIYE